LWKKKKRQAPQMYIRSNDFGVHEQKEDEEVDTRAREGYISE
jgi:hypothetical protein